MTNWSGVEGNLRQDQAEIENVPTHRPVLTTSASQGSSARTLSPVFVRARRLLGGKLSYLKPDDGNSPRFARR